MEYCEHGDLHKLLKKRKTIDEFDKQKFNYLSENTLWNFFIQICIGLFTMHS
jgi:hypothetical protein